MDTPEAAPTMAAMEKKTTATAVVREAAAQGALRRSPARDLSPDEDRVLRMRLGATPPRAAPLERAVEDGSDLEIELRALEIEAYLKWKARAGAATLTTTTVRVARPQPSRTKDKIVRALRKKA
jgi:hypothetical protein